jgi:hypothetical protein
MTIVLDIVHHLEFFQTFWNVSFSVIGCSAANVPVQLGRLERLLDVRCIMFNFSGIIERKLYCLLGCDTI